MNSRAVRCFLMTLNLASLSFCWQTPDSEYFTDLLKYPAKAVDGGKLPVIAEAEFVNPHIQNSAHIFDPNAVDERPNEFGIINVDVGRTTKDMVFGTTFFVIAVTAFVLNLVSVAAVYKVERKKIKRTLMILLNLVCLLLVPTMLGTAADRIYGGWNFGLLGCKVSNFFKIFCISLQALLCFQIVDYANIDVVPALPSFKKLYKNSKYMIFRTSVTFLIYFAVSFLMASHVWTRSDVNFIHGRGQCVVRVWDYEPEGAMNDLRDVSYYNYDLKDITIDDDESYEPSGEYYENFMDNLLEGIDLGDLDECGLSMASMSYKVWYMGTSLISYFLPLVGILFMVILTVVKSRVRIGEMLSVNRMVVLFLAAMICWTPINVYKVSTYFSVDLSRQSCVLFNEIASVLAQLSSVVLPSILIFYAARARREKEYDNVSEASEEKKVLFDDESTNRSDEFLA